MSVPKRGLGRGLGALLGDAPVPVTPSGEALRLIAIDQIKPNPYQPRKQFDAQALEELLGFLYAECCTRNKAVEPKKIVCCK